MSTPEQRARDLAAEWASKNENMLGVDAAEAVWTALGAPTPLDAMTPEARSAMFDREQEIADEAARRQAWGELQPNASITYNGRHWFPAGHGEDMGECGYRQRDLPAEASR
jgi:hypothetical protein